MRVLHREMVFPVRKDVLINHVAEWVRSHPNNVDSVLFGDKVQHTYRFTVTDQEPDLSPADIRHEIVHSSLDGLFYGETRGSSRSNKMLNAFCKSGQMEPGEWLVYAQD